MTDEELLDMLTWVEQEFTAQVVPEWFNPESMERCDFDDYIVDISRIQSLFELREFLRNCGREV
jgi:hypothetical protein